VDIHVNALQARNAFIAAVQTSINGPMSSPTFFFWRNITTNGMTSLGAPSPMTFGRTLREIFAFALLIFVDFLDL
jgi:hypothetical protein